MKKLLCMFTLCLGMVACSEGSSRTMVENDVAKTDVVEVIYFHGARRCATCMVIEEKTQEVIDSIFAEELKHGTLSFRSVDLSEEEALAEKYKVTWSALILVDMTKEVRRQSRTSQNFSIRTEREQSESQFCVFPVCKKILTQISRIAQSFVRFIDLREVMSLRISMKISLIPVIC